MEETVNNNPPANNPPPTPGQQPEQPSLKQMLPKFSFPHLSPFKLILFSAVGFVCLMGLLNVFLQLITPTKDTSGKSTNVTTNTAPAAVTWKTYTNKTYHYSVKYPDNLELSEETPYTTVFTVKNKPMGRLIFPALYVSVIPDKLDDSKKVYNFMTSDVINKFYNMQDGASMQTETGTNAEHWIFKKIAIIPIMNEQGIVIQNDNVFEGNGVINRRIFVKRNGITYLIGSYFGSQEELTNFRDFVLSFTFLQ